MPIAPATTLANRYKRKLFLGTDFTLLITRLHGKAESMGSQKFPAVFLAVIA
jgi:hypothetical protein